MARPLRIERAGGWYHITARGNERRPIFRDDRDRQHFCELLGEWVSRFCVHLHAFVLMDNHYHLIVELSEPNLSRACQWLNVSYSVWFNRRHERCGHLFQGRFKSVAVDPVQWGLALSRYVHLNPVRVGALGLKKSQQQRMRAGATGAPDGRVVKERVARLRRYRWSSYRPYAGLGKGPEWLKCDVILDMAGGKKQDQTRNYRDYVEEAVREGLVRNPWEELQDQVVLGSWEFLETLREHVKGNPREQPGARRLATVRPELSEVIASLEKMNGQSWPDIRDRHGDSSRDLALYIGRRWCGLTLQNLADAMELKEYGTVSAAIRRFEVKLRESQSEREQLRRVCQMLNIQM
jgi:putative transposase